MDSLLPSRWIAYSVFVLSTALNFLDRQLLAALAPQILTELGMSKGQYGDLLAVFSLTYAFSAPLMGWFIDRVGLRWGSIALVGAWSMAGMATGWVGGFVGLLAARAALGMAEAGSIPGSGKANALYLESRERSLGTAFNQVGITLGGVLAPLAGQWIAGTYGWRHAFVICGALGFVWIPLWWATTRKYPPAPLAPVKAGGESTAGLLRDTRFWLLFAANMAVMVIYSLWMNWTTVFLVAQHGLTQADANERLAWMAPVSATLGGLFGGWLSVRWARGGNAVEGRLRVVLAGCLLVLVTALIPLSPGPAWATAGVCLSFFACLMTSVNLYALPLDLFGPRRAGFAVAGLTCSYGVLQTLFSPIAGRVAFGPLLAVCAVLPLGGYLLARAAVRKT